MLALGAMVSVAASPVAAQMVIGGERPAVDVNWGVLDQLGPEPTLPALITRKPQPVKPVTSAHQGVVYKPYGGGHVATAAPHPIKVVKAKAATEAVAVPPKKTAPVVAEAKTAETPVVPPAEKVMAAAPPPKTDVAADVPAPPKAAKPVAESKVKAPVAPPPAPVVTETSPTKVEPAPSAVQFAKAPEPVAVPPTPPAPPPAPAVVAVPPPPPAPPPAPVVVAAPPPPAPVVVPAPAPPQQLAAVTPPAISSLRKGDNLSVLFASDSEHLPDTSRGDLEKLAQKMERDEGLTLQLLAYAAGDEANASKARRLSLTRALKVRTYLMELGVRSTRIEVRALGNKVEGGPADRVDLVLGSR